jgi:ribosomal protein S18 acetylase RimI-like enzyme
MEGRGGWAVIATFARRGMTQKGIGAALMEATKAAAQTAGLRVIDATIRADNSGGLAYYTRQGFIDYDVLKDLPLKDGTKVDRIRKRFDL